MFPMKITKTSARHRGRTKDYHLVLITTSDGRSMVVIRFGKKDQWGQMKVHLFNSIADGESFFSNKRDEKMGGEYTLPITPISVVEVPALDNLQKYLSAYWPKLGATNIEWLVPGADTKGVRDPDGPSTWARQPDGSLADEYKPRLVPDDEVEVDMASQVARDENWGSF